MGSGELIQTLMCDDLTDEYLLLKYPGGCSQTAGRRLPFAEYVAKHIARAERSPTLAAAAIATG